MILSLNLHHLNDLANTLIFSRPDDTQSLLAMQMLRLGAKQIITKESSRALAWLCIWPVMENAEFQLQFYYIMCSHLDCDWNSLASCIDFAISVVCSEPNDLQVMQPVLRNVTNYGSPIQISFSEMMGLMTSCQMLETPNLEKRPEAKQISRSARRVPRNLLTNTFSNPIAIFNGIVPGKLKFHFIFIYQRARLIFVVKNYHI